jgi:hypothetical protein
LDIGEVSTQLISLRAESDAPGDDAMPSDLKHLQFTAKSSQVEATKLFVTEGVSLKEEHLKRIKASPLHFAAAWVLSKQNKLSLSIVRP